MKKNILIILFLTYGLNLKAQSLIPESIIGIWKVENIINPPKNENFKLLIDSFEKAEFIFNKNHSFKIQSKINNKLFSMITEMTNISKWKVENNVIKIGTEKDNYTVMEIQLIEKLGKQYLYLGETTLTLEVTRRK